MSPGIGFVPPSNLRSGREARFLSAGSAPGAERAGFVVVALTCHFALFRRATVYPCPINVHGAKRTIWSSSCSRIALAEVAASGRLGLAGIIAEMSTERRYSRRLLPAGIDPPETRRGAPWPRPSRSPSTPQTVAEGNLVNFPLKTDEICQVAESVNMLFHGTYESFREPYYHRTSYCPSPASACRGASSFECRHSGRAASLS